MIHPQGELFAAEVQLAAPFETAVSLVMRGQPLPSILVAALIADGHDPDSISRLRASKR